MVRYDTNFRFSAPEHDAMYMVQNIERARHRQLERKAREDRQRLQRKQCSPEEMAARGQKLLQQEQRCSRSINPLNQRRKKVAEEPKKAQQRKQSQRGHK